MNRKNRDIVKQRISELRMTAAQKRLKETVGNLHKSNNGSYLLHGKRLLSRVS